MGKPQKEILTLFVTKKKSNIIPCLNTVQIAEHNSSLDVQERMRNNANFYFLFCDFTNYAWIC